MKKLPQSASFDNDPVANSRSVGSNITFIICSLVAAAAFLGAGYDAVRWAMIETTTTTESHLKMIESEYVKVGPASMIVEFEDMETNSLDLVSPYKYQLTVDEKNKWGWNASIAAGVALIFGLGAVVAASQGRSE
ncbi:MAG: hypothetical protein KDB00_06990 [Planctomycetales bacterium]|nr:hypothetical protein [Planctomycetales bacterium]